MGYKMLYVLVEGDDDVRFFERILEPRLKQKYDCIKIIKTAQKKIEDITKFLKSIKKMKRDYIYVRDIDNSPCITQKKKDIKGEISIIDEKKIVVVVKEIESWYLAGIKKEDARNLNITIKKNTNTITKEDFNQIFEKSKSNSRINFMIEILNHFSIEEAKEKNPSFKYFIEKFNL